MKLMVSQLRVELSVVARNGEQLLVIIGIPALLLLFFSNVDVLPTGGQSSVDFLLPGILALAVMSTAMVSLGIATGFERSYSVLKRLGATPLGTPRLILAKTCAVGVVEALQCSILIIFGMVLGWSPNGTSWMQCVAAIALGTLAFAGLGLLMAGTLTAELNLAAQNAVYLLLLLVGGVVIPIASLPSGLQSVAIRLPSSALTDVLREALTNAGSHPQSSWVTLCLWASLTPLLASRWFRWD
ncbi:MAG: ABC transporter permease [Ilumatobacteraceae bacterium]